ncbi:unnamed protein product [Cuscuta epithymum]|uniref:Integrase catalytic domain-containing protein n=1 Tax=Cuscuta epithymum TaxID=186058 RepID=A0AAV0FVW0_9ASTE|nr:unnamed protein product [Cuscuta epithymum]
MGTLWERGYLADGLFVLSTVSDNAKSSPSFAYMAESVNVWHGRLGHVNFGSLKKLRNMHLINVNDTTEHSKCQICVEAKHARKPFKEITTRQTELLELIHSDLADFKNTESRGGKRYYMTFIDDFSRYAKVYLLRSKDEAGEMFMKYKAEVENQLDRKIKRLRSDRGGEYNTNFLKEFCEKHGIIHESSAPYTPQQNGVAERKNRTLKDMMNSMLLSAGLSDNLWGEAVLSACYILNKVPHKRIEKTPYELWKGYSPNLNHLRVWGCIAKVGFPDFKRTNIGPKTFDCVFIGYAQGSAAYRFVSLNDRTICESRDAEFFEHIFPLKKHVDRNDCDSSVVNNLHNIHASSVPVLPVCSLDTPKHVTGTRKGKRKRRETSFGPDFLTTYLVEHSDQIDESFVSVFLLEQDPKTYSEAVTSIDASFWKEAIRSELDSIMCNHTWDLVDLPEGCKPINCKWIFKRKLRPNGTIEKFKARLVVVGYTQKKGIDYFDTYSPVTKIATIRSLVALAAINDLVVHQMDVKTAFLNGDLEEEIYMRQPEGYVVPGQENKVCKLKRSLYGLKQAPKQWYEKFNNTVVGNGFTVNASDSCVYSKMFGPHCVIICLYVDDMLIFGTNEDVVTKTKHFLSSHFEMKDLGKADLILGVKLTRTENGFSMCQSHYIEKLLKKFNYFDVTPVRTPYDPSTSLKKNEGSSISQEEYAKILGSVMFLMNYTRPDIAYAVSRLSRYTHNPSYEHWNALHRLLKYLKGAVSWKSAKQTCIARSTMEAEFIALELAGQEAEWLRNLLADIPLWGNKCVPVPLHCDSQAAISVAVSSVYNGKRRHIRIRHASLKLLIKNSVISLDYVKSERNLADPLTKGLARKLVLESSKGMGLMFMD